ncbi:hypothetical protein ACFSYB_15215 [Litchfieldia salsa]
MSQKLNQLKELEHTQKDILHQIEETFSGYIMQIKEENEHFFKHANSSMVEEQLEKKQEQSVSNNQSVQKESVIHTVKEEDQMSSPKHLPFSMIEQTISEADLKDLLPEYTDIEPPKIEVKDKEKVKSTAPITSEKLLLDKIISMESEGATIEEIAKTLNRGKTEIELLLKFRQK